VDVTTPVEQVMRTIATIFQGSTSAQIILHNKHVNAYLVDSLKVLMLTEPFPTVVVLTTTPLASYAAAIAIRGSALSGGALRMNGATHAVSLTVD
jgi:hypothetical protein